MPTSDIPFPTLASESSPSFSESDSNQLSNPNLSSFPRSTTISSSSSKSAKTSFPHLSRKSSLLTSKSIKIKLANQEYQQEVQVEDENERGPPSLCESSTQTEDSLIERDDLPSGRVSADRISLYLRNLNYSDDGGEDSSAASGGPTPPLTPSPSPLPFFSQFNNQDRDSNPSLAYGGGIERNRELYGLDSDSSDELVSDDFGVFDSPTTSSSLDQFGRRTADRFKGKAREETEQSSFEELGRGRNREPKFKFKSSPALQIQTQRRASDLLDLASDISSAHRLNLEGKSSDSSNDSNQTQVAFQGSHSHSFDSHSNLQLSTRDGNQDRASTPLPNTENLGGDLVARELGRGLSSRFSWSDNDDRSETGSEDSDLFGTAMDHSDVFSDTGSSRELSSNDQNGALAGEMEREDEVEPLSHSETSSLSSRYSSEEEKEDPISSTPTSSGQENPSGFPFTSTPPSRPLSSHSQLRALTLNKDSKVASDGSQTQTQTSPSTPTDSSWSSRASSGRTSPFQRLNFSTFKRVLGGGDGKGEEARPMEISKPFQGDVSNDSPSSPKSPTPRRRLRSFILLGSPNLSMSPISNRPSTSGGLPNSSRKENEHFSRNKILDHSKRSSNTPSVYDFFSRPSSPTSPRSPTHPRPQAPTSPTNLKGSGMRRTQSSSLLNSGLGGPFEDDYEIGRTRAIRLSFDDPDPFAKRAMVTSPTPSSPVYQMSTLQSFDFGPVHQLPSTPPPTSRKQLQSPKSPILSLSPNSSTFGSVNSSSSHIVIESDKESKAAPSIKEAKRLRKVSSTGSLPKKSDQSSSGSQLSSLKYTKQSITPIRESFRPYTSPVSSGAGSTSKRSSIAYNTSPSWKRNDWKRYGDGDGKVKTKLEVAKERARPVTQVEDFGDENEQEEEEARKLMGEMRKTLLRKHHSTGADFLLSFKETTSTSQVQLASTPSSQSSILSDSNSNSDSIPLRSLSHAKASSNLRAFYTNSGSTWREELKKQEAKKLESFRKDALDNLTALESGVDLDLSLRDFGELNRAEADEVETRGGEVGLDDEPNMIGGNAEEIQTSEKSESSIPVSAPRRFESPPKTSPSSRSRSNSASKVLLQYQRVRTLYQPKSRTRRALKSLGESFNRNRGVVDGFSGGKAITHSKSLDFTAAFPSQGSKHKRQSPSMPINIFGSKPLGRKSLVRRSVATQTDFTLITSTQEIVPLHDSALSNPISTNHKFASFKSRNFTPSPRVNHKLPPAQETRSTRSIDGLSQFDNQRFSGDYSRSDPKKVRRSVRESMVEGSEQHQLRGVRSFGAKLKSLGKRVRLTSRASRADLEEALNSNH